MRQFVQRRYSLTTNATLVCVLSAIKYFFHSLYLYVLDRYLGGGATGRRDILHDGRDEMCSAIVFSLFGNDIFTGL